MDPLSITASVIALLTAASSVVTVLKTVKSSLNTVPQSITQAIAQVAELHTILTMMQRFIDGVIVPQQNRLKMIQVDQLIATLTEAVMTFSEFEALIGPLAIDGNDTIVERMKWSWKEDAVAKILQRLERHKSSFSLMLNIAQCESDLEARDSQQKLHEVIARLLEGNEEICRRLKELGSDGSDPGTAVQSTSSSEEVTILPRDGVSSEDIETSISMSRSIEHQHAFEHDLEVSRVYKRAAVGECDVSFRTSVAYSHAWSSYSGLSLSEMSNIAVIALPLSRVGLATSLLPLTQQPFTKRASMTDPYKNMTTLEWHSLSKVLTGTDQQVNHRASTPRSKVRPSKSTNLHRLRIHVFGLDKMTRLGVIDHCHDTFDTTRVIGDGSPKVEKCMPLHYADSVLLLYDRSCRGTLDRVLQVHKELEKMPFTGSGPGIRRLRENAFIMVVANRSSDILQVLEVPTKEGHALAREIGAQFVTASLPSSFGADNRDFSNRILELMRLTWNLYSSKTTLKRSKDRQNSVM